MWIPPLVLRLLLWPDAANLRPEQFSMLLFSPHSTSPSKSTLNHTRLLPHHFWVCHFALLPPPHPPKPWHPLSFSSQLISLSVSFSLCLLFASLFTVQSVVSSFSLHHGGEFLSVWVCVISYARVNTWIRYVLMYISLFWPKWLFALNPILCLCIQLIFYNLE